MHTTSLAATPTRPALWAARACFAVAVLFLAFDGIGKLATPVQVVDAFTRLGIPMSAATGLGILQLACLVLYVIPRTAVLGAVLLTGFLGGAIAIHVRAGGTPFELLFPVIIGGLVWAPLYLRDERVRQLLPVRG
jgi:hypothetical protein